MLRSRDHEELFKHLEAIQQEVISKAKLTSAVNGAALLHDLRSFVSRYVVLSDGQATVIALWIVHTHLLDAFDVTAYLDINSAEKQSGKTRLLEVLNVTVAKPWLTGRVSVAVLVRKVDSEQPTLLLDEGDAAFNGEKEYAEALRGILNTGYLRDGKASLCVGQGAQISFKDFSTFCAKAIAGIGHLPDTVADRSIPIRLKRAAPREVVARFRRRDIPGEVMPLCERIDNWCSQIKDSLADARPELPSCLSDRQQDVIEPLLAIADVAGDEWPEKSRSALLTIFRATPDESSTGVRLLADIRTILDGNESDTRREYIESAELADALGRIETSPWGEWSKGRPITATKLAYLLKPFGVAPVQQRVGEANHRCYHRSDFEDAWLRYLSRTRQQSATTLQTNTDAGSDDFSNRYAAENVAPAKCEIANENGPCSGVAVPEARIEEKGIEEEL